MSACPYVIDFLNLTAYSVHSQYIQSWRTAMLISLDNSGSIPFYQQIQDQIRDMILTGALEPGELLPSIRQLSSKLLTSVITVKRAYQDLENEGLIMTRPGVGTFVRSLKPEDVVKSRIGLVEALVTELAQTAVRLGVSKEEIIEMIQNIMDPEVQK